MKELLWKALAWFISREPIADWLIERSKRTPYFHLDGYMHRWWVFNDYDDATHKTRYPCSYSARVHHILRADNGRDPHDHPWNARTIILKGYYIEERDGGTFIRDRGDTATISANTFHNVTRVSPGGVFTLFITGDYIHRWGFRVNGKKVPYTEYDRNP